MIFEMRKYEQSTKHINGGTVLCSDICIILGSWKRMASIKSCFIIEVHFRTEARGKWGGGGRREEGRWRNEGIKFVSLAPKHVSRTLNA